MVVLGADAAERLGVVRVDRQPSIFIGDRAYQVIGIVDDVQRRSDVLDAVLMPDGTARADFGARAHRRSCTCTSRSAPDRSSAASCRPR